MKHTKGPWKYQRSESESGELYGYHILLDQDGWLWIGDVNNGNIIDSTQEEALANAKLISSAPELLETLKGLIKQIKYPQAGSSGKDGDMIRLPNIEKAEQVIKKATE